MKIRQLFILFFMAMQCAIAQSPEDANLDVTQTVIPASPTVAALEQYAAIPVSKNTGVPNISIPLGTISGKSISAPISLSYHASGIKVSDYGSWVGLGWSLQGGGVISRSVNGLADEAMNGYWNTNTPIPLAADLEEEPNLTSALKVYYERVIDGLEDTEPDVFTLTYPEGSATFMINKAGEAVFFPYQNIKVQLSKTSNNNISSFEITAPSGNRYIFAEKERTVVLPDAGNPRNYTSGWMLTEIIAPNNLERIRLTYADESYTMGETKTYTDYYKTSILQSDCLTPSPSVSTSTVGISGKRLSSIENLLTGHKAVFVANTTSRSDLVGMHQLSKIQFYQKTHLTKEWELNYQTFGGIGGRPKLKSVLEKGKNGAAKPPYTFDYNSQTLPAVNDLGIDHWGYYTGRSESTALPQTFIPFQSYILSLAGANRSADDTPDAMYMKMGILTKISYPLGGFTSFEYEPHDYGVNQQGIPVNNEYIEDKSVDLSCEGCGTNDVSFTPTYTGYARINYHFSCSNCSNGSLPLSSPSFDIKEGNAIIYGRTPNNTYPSQGEEWILVEAGKTYTLVVESIGSPTVTAKVAAEIHYQDLAQPVAGSNNSKIERAGGLRIKKITRHDGLSVQNDIIQNFTYRMADENDRSSGILIEKPAYYHAYSAVNQTNTIAVGSNNVPGFYLYAVCAFIRRSANQTIRSTSSGGGHLYYKEVVEEIGDGSQGYTRTRYKDYPFSGTSNYHPFPQRKPDGYKLGLVAEEETYSSTNKLLYKESYVYAESVLKNSITDFKVGNLVNSAHPSVYDRYGYNRREFESRPFYLTQKTITSYDENGQYPQVQTISYTYDDDHLNATVVSTQNSDGVTYITKTKYPTEYASGTADVGSIAIQKLKEQHRHNLPIETTQWRLEQGGTPMLLQGKIQTYETLSSDLVVPQSVYMTELTSPLSLGSYTISSVNSTTGFELDNSYQLRGKLTGHDAYGNVLGFQKTKDKINSLIWGYDAMLPTLRASNAHHSEIGYTSFEGGDEVLWNISNASSRTTGKVGAQALQVTEQFPFGRVFEVAGQDKKYKFSAWVKTNDATYSYLVLRTCAVPNNATYPDPNTAPSYVQVGFTSTNGAWQLVEVEIDLDLIRDAAGVPAHQALAVHAYLWNPHQKTIALDAARFHPSDAFVETYDYDAATFLSMAMEKVNRLHSSYAYDDFQRLSFVKDFEGNIIAAHDYHYKGSSGVENYVKTQALRVEGKTTLADLVGLPLHQLTESYQYLDGLGRPIQSVGKGQSPQQKDVVSFKDYDVYGRESKRYLPFVGSSNTGAFTTNPLSLVQTFYSTTIATESQTNYPFSETVFEASPLNRPKEQSSEGDGWQIGSNHTLRNSYGHNQANEVLQLDYANPTAQYYHANTLSKTEVVNTKGVKSVQYVDKLGRTVLVKQQVGPTTWTNTYTLYDAFGNVKAIVTPLAIEQMQQTGNYNYTHSAYNELIYEYTYDARQRLIGKKIPNSAVVEYVYDQLDRLVATQDGKQRLEGQWMVQKYDQHSRPILSALYGSGMNQVQLQQFFDQQTHFFEKRAANTVGYTNTIPVLSSNDVVLNVSYYDDYDFDNDGQIDADNAFVVDGAYATTYFDRTIGLATGSKVRILDASNRFLKQVNFYDARGRVIQTKQQNHLSGEDITWNKYDFVGNLTQMKYHHTTHQRQADNEVSTEEFFIYDHAGRLTEVYHRVGNEDKVLLSQQNYDELGRLIEKNLHSTNEGVNFLQSIDYHYNVRNWLVRINDLYPVSPASTDPLPSSTSTLQKRIDEIVVEYNRQDLETGKVQTEIKIDDETVDLVNGIVVASQQTQTEVDLYGEGYTTTNKDEEIRVDFSDQTVEEGNISASLEELEKRLEQKLTENGLTNPVIMELLLEDLKAEYRDRWLLLRSSADNEDNEDLFSMNFDYDYGGNIHHLEWKVASYDYRSIYDYDYDNLDRLTTANYKEYLESSTPLLPVYQCQNDFSVNNITYDIMGNITHLERRGTIGVLGSSLTNGVMDDLTYFYDNNQLKVVQDLSNQTAGFKDGANSSREYYYDVNGNLTRDDNKQIVVSYNHLNLPKQIQFTQENATIEWLYSAGGEKLQKAVTDANRVTTYKHYIGKVHYVNTEVDFIQHAEGRIIRNLVGIDVSNNPIYDYRYEYNLKDHLGNNRVFFSDTDKDGIVEVSQTGGHNELLQQEHYYPFGMGIKGEWKFVQPQIGGTNLYQYNGKELNEDFGLNWNDYGARWYDASIGRWNAVDPLAEDYLPWSGYNYVLGNPLKFIDPDGMRVEDHYILNKQGEITKVKETDDDFDVLIAAESTEEAYDKDGNISKDRNSTTVEKGVLAGMRSKDFKLSNGEKIKGHAISLGKNSEKKAENLFEFLADNTEVEWSLISAGGGLGTDNEITYSTIYTTHENHHERWGTQQAKYWSERKGINILKHTHNHPRKWNEEKYSYHAASDDDERFAKNIRKSMRAKYKKTARTNKRAVNKYFKVELSIRSEGKYIGY